MFFKASIIAMAGLVAGVVAESHTVSLINNCGSGTPVFTYQGVGEQSFGSGTYDRIKGGVAWLSNYQDKNCLFNGRNCGTVEFTLTDPGHADNDNNNSADYSLLDGTDPDNGHDLGNHQFTYPMNFKFTGSCTKAAPAQCTGDSKEACQGGFLDNQTKGGAPVECQAVGAGIEITFC